MPSAAMRKIKEQYEQRILSMQEELSKLRSGFGPTKVYLVGSHRVGKTTLAKWISSTYNLPLLTEVARVVLAEMEEQLDKIRPNVALVGQYQRDVFRRQIEMERRFGTTFVSDRSFDNLCYAAEYTDVYADLLESTEAREYLAGVRQQLVFFVRPDPLLARPDHVATDANYLGVARIDAMVKGLLEQYRIPYIPIDTPEQQQRQRLIGGVMRLAGFAPKP